MSIETPVGFASPAAETPVEPQGASQVWLETALTVLFAAATVLFVSFVAVVTGLA